MHQINIKRVSDPLGLHDGVRILIDRLWPGGVKKSEGHIDLWLKDIAPSSELRRFFNHNRQKWTTFRQSYIEELKYNRISSINYLVSSIKVKLRCFIMHAIESITTPLY